MTHTHYTQITRDDAGLIERIGPRCTLGKRGLPGIPGATAESRIVSTEAAPVIGWGDASAIGLVEILIDGQPEGPPALCLLSA